MNGEDEKQLAIDDHIRRQLQLQEAQAKVGFCYAGTIICALYAWWALTGRFPKDERTKADETAAADGNAGRRSYVGALAASVAALAFGGLTYTGTREIARLGFIERAERTKRHEAMGRARNAAAEGSGDAR